LTEWEKDASISGMKAQPKMSPKYAGRLGGLKGGVARRDKLSPEVRREIARRAAEARWKKESESKKKS
jgi:hypothetical protein